MLLLGLLAVVAHGQLAILYLQRLQGAFEEMDLVRPSKWRELLERLKAITNQYTGPIDAIPYPPDGNRSYQLAVVFDWLSKRSNLLPPAQGRRARGLLWLGTGVLPVLSFERALFASHDRRALGEGAADGCYMLVRALNEQHRVRACLRANKTFVNTVGMIHYEQVLFVRYLQQYLQVVAELALPLSIVVKDPRVQDMAVIDVMHRYWCILDCLVGVDVRWEPPRDARALQSYREHLLNAHPTVRPLFMRTLPPSLPLHDIAFYGLSATSRVIDADLHDQSTASLAVFTAYTMALAAELLAMEFLHCDDDGVRSRRLMHIHLERALSTASRIVQLHLRDTAT